MLSDEKKLLFQKQKEARLQRFATEASQGAGGRGGDHDVSLILQTKVVHLNLKPSSPVNLALSSSASLAAPSQSNALIPPLSLSAPASSSSHRVINLLGIKRTSVTKGRATLEIKRTKITPTTDASLPSYGGGNAIGHLHQQQQQQQQSTSSIQFERQKLQPFIPHPITAGATAAAHVTSGGQTADATIEKSRRKKWQHQALWLERQAQKEGIGGVDDYNDAMDVDNQQDSTDCWDPLPKRKRNKRR